MLFPVILLHLTFAEYVKFPCKTWSSDPVVFPLGIAIDKTLLDYEGMEEKDLNKWLKVFVDPIKKVYMENFNVELRVVGVLLPSQYPWLRGNSANFSKGKCRTLDMHSILYSFNTFCGKNCPTKAVAWHLILGGSCFSGAPGYATSVGGACSGNAVSVGINMGMTNQNWWIAAHEVAHLLGADHQSKGVMAPGPASLKIYKDVKQFTDTDPAEVERTCSTMDRVAAKLKS